MLDTEIASIVKSVDTYEIAQKTRRNIALNDNEKIIASQLDEWAREIGNTGYDEKREIAEFVRKTINEEFYNAPDELLDYMFDRGSVGEFDDYEATVTPKNTLISYEAAKGGNVDKSYLDISVIKPKWKNRQIETEISYADLRRNGWKSVALLTTYSMDALNNVRFKDIFSDIDTLIANGAENYISNGGTVPTAAAMDAMALYLNDRNQGGGVIVALSKYIQNVSKLKGFDSEAMRDEVHLNGKLGAYDGCSLHGISGAKKYGDGTLLMPDKRIFGIAGKIGTLDMKGDVHIYEDMDNDNEKVELKIKDFTYGWAFNKDTLENVCKIVTD